MPKAAPQQTSFSSGEVSPLYYGHSDNPRYKKGLKTGLNFIPLLQGPLVRRPATKFCAQSKYTTAPSIIPFVFSQDQAYILEFGSDGVLTDSQYIRFYANNGRIVTTAASYKVEGLDSLAFTYNDPSKGNAAIGLFYGTRALSQLQENEFSITNSTPVASGSILEIKTPYRLEDLPGLRWAQKGDTLYLAHPSYPLYKLQRQGNEFWKLSRVVLQDGPYLALNSYETVCDSTNMTLEVVGFVAPPPGTGLLRTLRVNVNSAVADGLTNQIIIGTTAAHGMRTGQNVFIAGVGGTTEANNFDSSANPAGAKAYWPVQVIDSTHVMLLGSNFVNAYTAGGTLQAALFALSADAYRTNFLGGTALVPDASRLLAFIVSGTRYYGYMTAGGIIGGVSSNAAQWYIAWPQAAATPATPATAWQMGIHSPGRGFPSCVTFHQDRLVLGGPLEQVNGSVVGEYENFRPSSPTTLNVTDDDAYSFNLTSSESNIMNWMASTAQGLLAGTLVSEWVITPASTADALTPTNFNAQQSSAFGAAVAAPVQIGNGTLYIQRYSRKVREMAFFFAAGTFRSINLSELSDHLTVPSVTQLAVTKESQPLIWAVRSDGALLSLVYSRDDQNLIAGWTPHVLGGQSDAAGTPPVVSSIAAIPSGDLSFDQLWCVVKRYINGATVYYLEYMTRIFDDQVEPEDAFQGDCGGTLFNPVSIFAITIANPCVMTAKGPSATFPGFTNGDRVRVRDVLGLTKKITDVNGNVTYENLVNDEDFIVANVVNSVALGVRTSTFDLHDFQGNPISSVGYGAYLSGGTVTKMVTTVSGLTWLVGETLSVLADGIVQSDVVVNNAGQITLQDAASKVTVGYSFRSRGQLLRMDAGAADGTSIAKTRRTTRLGVQMYRTGELSLGTSFDRLCPVDFVQADVDHADQPVPLFSGIVRPGLESAYDFDSQPCFEMKSMLPGCIQSMTIFMEENDV